MNPFQTLAMTLIALWCLTGCGGGNPTAAINSVPDIRIREMSDKLTARLQEETGTQLTVAMVRIEGKPVNNASNLLRLATSATTLGWSNPEKANRIVLLVEPNLSMFRVEYGPDVPMRSISYFERNILAAFVGWMEGVGCTIDTPNPRASGMTCIRSAS